MAARRAPLSERVSAAVLQAPREGLYCATPQTSVWEQLIADGQKILSVQKTEDSLMD